MERRPPHRHAGTAGTAHGGIEAWDWVENSPDLLHGRRCKCLFEGVKINVINKYSIFTYIADCDFCTASAAADKHPCKNNAELVFF